MRGVGEVGEWEEEGSDGSRVVQRKTAIGTLTEHTNVPYVLQWKRLKVRFGWRAQCVALASECIYTLSSLYQKIWS